MTKATARAILRRRLQEITPEKWENHELHGLLNEALKKVQTDEIAIDPYAYMAIKTVNTVVGSAGEFYELPSDLWYIHKVGHKATASQPKYTRLKRGDYDTISEYGEDRTVEYAIYGRYLALWPNPTAAVTAGLRIHYMPTLALGDDESVLNDALVLPVHPALHMATIAAATMMAMGETEEDQTPRAAEYRFYINSMPAWRHRGGEPSQIQLDLNRDS